MRERNGKDGGLEKEGKRKRVRLILTGEAGIIVEALAIGLAA